MMRLYELHGIAVNEILVTQYLQNPKIAKNFSIYYDLFKKYQSDYQVDMILAGEAPEEIQSRAKNAKFDERLALLGLILSAITQELRQIALIEQTQANIAGVLKNVRLEFSKIGTGIAAVLQNQITMLEKKIEAGKHASTLSADEEYACCSAVTVLQKMMAMLKEKASVDSTEAFKLIKKVFDDRNKMFKKQADDAGKQLSNAFVFCEKVFGEGQELLILVTELTISYYGAHYIGRYGCKEYFAHNKELLFYERQKEIITELDDLEL